MFAGSSIAAGRSPSLGPSTGRPRTANDGRRRPTTTGNRHEVARCAPGQGPSAMRVSPRGGGQAKMACFSPFSRAVAIHPSSDCRHCTFPLTDRRSSGGCLDGESQLRREAHRAVVGGLGAEHHRLAGKRVGEPAERSRARRGGVPVAPSLWEEQAAELGLPGIRTDMTPMPRVASVEFEARGCGRVPEEWPGTRLFGGGRRGGAYVTAAPSRRKADGLPEVRTPGRPSRWG
jgi:hypothetical protein